MKLVKRILSAAALSVLALSAVSLAKTAEAGALPDLVIRDFNLHPTGKCGPLGSVIRGTVTVKNVGRARARALIFTPLIKVYDQHDQSIKDADVKINSLAPGETTRVRVSLGRLRFKDHLGGWRKIIIKVDPKDKIRETNELNNSYSVRVPVRCR
ncbi:MAG: CARDB domain-containing protein [Methyloligellaceae bacterium]